MAKITELTLLDAVPATDDLIANVDVSDTTDSAVGTTKRVTRKNYLGYTEYVALLTQTGTNAPVATVIYNDTGATVSYAYLGIGLYDVTFTPGVLTINKTAIMAPNTAYGFVVIGHDNNGSTFQINTTDGTNMANGVLVAATLVVRIYI